MKRIVTERSYDRVEHPVIVWDVLEPTLQDEKEEILNAVFDEMIAYQKRVGNLHVSFYLVDSSARDIIDDAIQNV